MCPQRSSFWHSFDRLAEVWKDLVANSVDGKIVSTAFTGIGAQYFKDVFQNYYLIMRA